MELPHIGQICVVCNRNDYLPFKCQHCEKIVCIDHKADHGTDCPLAQTTFDATTVQLQQSESIKQACDFCRKITLKLELSLCTHCSGSHCLYHRHQVQHNCIRISENVKSVQLEKESKAQRQRDALDRLKQIQDERKASNANTSHEPPVQLPNHVIIDPKKRALARRVRIMKIKQTSRGPPNVLDQDKIFFEVKYQHEPKSSLSSEFKHGKTVNIFATPKHTVGRLVDFAATELDLCNNNHIEGSDQLSFLIGSTGSELTYLDNQKYFKTYIESGTLDSGDQLLMTYALGK